MARPKIGYRIGKQTVPSNTLSPKDHPSECVQALEYNMETQEMIVHFQARGSYAYFNVEPDVYMEFNNASMRGAYFNLYVRGRYEYDRLSST